MGNVAKVDGSTDRNTLIREIKDEMQEVARRDNRVQAIRLMNLDDIYRFATTALGSSMLPSSYKVGGNAKVEDVVLAVQMGSELGLPPMQSILNIAVINQRPSVWGDAMPGLCRSSGRCEYIKESFTGEGDTLTAICEAKRRDDPNPIIQEFSVSDAKTARLWGKQGPWATNPKRMLQMRARGFALRDAFPDVLRGLISSEEAMDIPSDSYSGITIDSSDVREKYNSSDASLATSPHATTPKGEPPKSTDMWLAGGLMGLSEEPPGYKWVQLLTALLLHCTTLEQHEALRNAPSVVNAIKVAPLKNRRQIEELFSQAAARLSNKAFPDTGEVPFDDPEGQSEEPDVVHATA